MFLFDKYIFVDWSAANQRAPAQPEKHSIWVGTLTHGQSACQTTYCRTRADAYEIVLKQLLNAVAERARVLVGFDFPYGYPNGFGSTLGFVDSRWSGVWRKLHTLIVDDNDNHNNRFEVAAQLNAQLSNGPGPFWGCPKARANTTLQETSPGFPFTTRSGVVLDRLRECERRLPGTQEAWKLYTTGSVGSQALVGIPCVHDLRHDSRLADVSLVWPFETGFAPLPERTPLIIHAEIWPGVVSDIAKHIRARVPDEAQVIAMCEWTRDLDAGGQLVRELGQPLNLTATQLATVIGDEGWVLGARV